MADKTVRCWGLGFSGQLGDGTGFDWNTPVQVSGKAQSISGRCPAIRFDLGGTTIATNGDTDFRNLKCTDVKKGVRLTVQGVSQPNGAVLATQVTRTSD